MKFCMDLPIAPVDLVHLIPSTYYSNLRAISDLDRQLQWCQFHCRSRSPLQMVALRVRFEILFLIVPHSLAFLGIITSIWAGLFSASLGGSQARYLEW